MLILLIFLVCAGCFDNAPSHPALKEETDSSQNAAQAFSLSSGTDIVMDDGQWSLSRMTTMKFFEWLQMYPQLRPTKSLDFVDDLQGYGLAQDKNEMLFMETSNGGRTWQVRSRLESDTGNQGLTFLDAQTGWLLTGGKDVGKSQLQLTSDGGLTWEIIARNLPGLSGTENNSFFRFFDRQNGLIALKDDSSLLILRTSDGGLTWSASSRIQLPQGPAGVVTFVSPTNGWYAAPGKKASSATILYRMTDGETWQEAGKLPRRLIPQAISFSNSQEGSLLLCSYDKGPTTARWQLLQTVDGGVTWIQHHFPDTFNILESHMQINMVEPQSGWIMGANGLWRTENGGLNWSLLAM